MASLKNKFIISINKSIIFWTTVRTFKYTMYFPILLPSIFAYLMLSGNRKKMLLEDLENFYKVEYQRKRLSNITAFYRLMVEYPAFRNVFYHRLSYFSWLISWTLPKWETLEISTLRIGGGIYIQHGTSTILTARSIGKNLWVNQNVTIGWEGLGCPIIGNNVRIGTGAVVIGPITIGDNVKIGANAIVTKDVPSNTTVVSPHAFIIKRDGKRVHEELLKHIYE